MIKTLTKLSKKYPIITDELAHAYLDGDSTDKAFKIIHKFLKQYPDSVTGLIVCALAHEEVGEEEEAETLYRQVLELEPRNIRAITRMAALESDNSEESDYWKKSLAAVDPLSPWIQAVEVPVKGRRDIDDPEPEAESFEEESAAAPLPEAEVTEKVYEERSSNEFYEDIDEIADAETGEAVAEKMPEPEYRAPVEEELADVGTLETELSQPIAEEEAAELPTEEAAADDNLAEEFEMPEIDVKYQEPDDLSDKLLNDLAALEGEETPIDVEPSAFPDETETELIAKDEPIVEIESEETDISVEEVQEEIEPDAESEYQPDEIQPAETETDIDTVVTAEDLSEIATEPEPEPVEEPETESAIDREEEIAEPAILTAETDIPKEETGVEITEPVTSLESETQFSEDDLSDMKEDSIASIPSAEDEYPERIDEAETGDYAPSADEISELQKVYQEIDEHSNSKQINNKEEIQRDIQTITLAEIYAKQGSYEEALVIYNALPEDVKIQYMDEIQRLESLINQNPEE